jgi:uncharacterized protein (TIGR03437 family)
VATNAGSGAQTSTLTFQADPNGVAFINGPIDLSGAATQAYVSLYGTRFRAATRATAPIADVSVPVAGFAAQAETLGLDQINIGPIPASLRGQTNAPVIVTFDDIETNTVTLSFR